MNFYLRLEAVNLSNFIDDTDDLSTVRGGGLLLRRAPRDVCDQWPELSPVSVGASTGIFEFDARDDDQAQVMRRKVEAFLRSHADFRHATFVVDVCAAGAPEQFGKDRERLLAINRWRQWRQPTTAVPGSIQGIGHGACVIDKIRPATGARPGPQETMEQVSESVLVRSNFGRGQKRQDFYADEIGQTIGRKFSRDFEELAAAPLPPFEDLDGKMGVIYLDGNKFGEKQNRHCPSVDEQRKFDKRVQDFRRRFLAALLDEAGDTKHKARWISKHGRIRLEVLLWGGDELLIVVPGWAAWNTLRLFYAMSRDLTFAGDRLTHKGGLVLCHHNAPIQRIRILAERLARHAKGNGENNAFAYVVLESFDDVGLDVDQYLDKRYGGTGMTLTDRLDTALGEMMTLAEKEMPRLRGIIPSRQLHRIAADVAAHRAQASDIESLTAAAAGSDAGLRDIEKAFGSSTPDAGGHAPLWLHLLELWDYVSPGAGSTP